ncbi:MAG: hypothetical protein DCC49_13295 [Acidobacteria bacterium]|nr:MAG: hypothetical protein DCC49_13295 [Acidobacteriota bacterium]
MSDDAITLEPERESPPPNPGAKKLLRSVIPAFLLSRVLIWIAGAGYFAAREPVIGTALFSRRTWQSVYHLVTGWDGQWYIAAATRGYGPSGVNPDGQSTAPFFPLLPGLIKAGGYLGLSPGLTGLLIASSAFFACLSLLFLLGWEKGGEVMARRVTWFAALSPFAFVFSMIYPDGIFMAASIGAFLLVRRERWLWAALAAVPAALVRPNGLVLAIALGYAAWTSGGDLKERLSRLIPLGLPAAAVTGWILALQAMSGNGFAFVSSKVAWNELAVWDAIPATVNLLTGGSGQTLPVAAAIHLALAGLGGYVLIAGRKIYDRGWGLYCVLVMAAPAVLGIIGLARYMIALFPLYIALADLVDEGGRAERWLIFGTGLATPVILAGVFMGRLVP